MTDKMAMLNRRSANARAESAALRRAIYDGDLPMGEVLARPPSALAAVPLVDLVRWQRFFGPGRLRALNVRAVKDRMNLCVMLGESSSRTRVWLARELGQTESFYRVSQLEVAA